MSVRLCLIVWHIYADAMHDFYLLQIYDAAAETRENIDFRFSRAQSPKGYECTMSFVKDAFYVDSVTDIPYEVMARLRQHFPQNPLYRRPFDIVRAS